MAGADLTDGLECCYGSNAIFAYAILKSCSKGVLRLFHYSICSVNDCFLSE
jgi:hypothetical protein